MPDAPNPITSPPPVDGQPWDATSVAPVAGWKSVDPDAGSVSFDTGQSSGDHFSNLPDAGDGGWKQT
jgi:hypothetical protein